MKSNGYSITPGAFGATPISEADAVRDLNDSQTFRLTMEKFITIGTIEDQRLADKLATALEEAGISVTMAHVRLFSMGIESTGYKITVPASRCNEARLLAEQISNTHVGRLSIASLAQRAIAAGVPEPV